MDTVSSLDQERQQRPRDRGAQSGRRHFGAGGHCSSVERVAPQSTQQLRPPGPPPGAGSRRAQTRRVRHARWRALRLLLSYRIYITGLSYRIYITGLSLCSCLPKVESRTPLCRAGYGRSDPAGGLRLARGAQHAQFDVADRLGFHTRAHLTGAEARPRETGAAPGGACIQPYRSARSLSQIRTQNRSRRLSACDAAQPSAGCHGRDVARRNRGGTRESCNAQ